MNWPLLDFIFKGDYTHIPTPIHIHTNLTHTLTHVIFGSTLIINPTSNVCIFHGYLTEFPLMEIKLDCYTYNKRNIAT